MPVTPRKTIPELDPYVGDPSGDDLMEVSKNPGSRKLPLSALPLSVAAAAGDSALSDAIEAAAAVAAFDSLRAKYTIPKLAERRTSLGALTCACYVSSIDAFVVILSGEAQAYDAGSGEHLWTLTNSALNNAVSCCYASNVDRVLVSKSNKTVSSINPATPAIDLNGVDPDGGVHSFGQGTFGLDVGQMIYRNSDGFVYVSNSYISPNPGVAPGEYAITGIDPATGLRAGATWLLGSGPSYGPFPKDNGFFLNPTDDLFYIIESNSANWVTRLNANGTDDQLFMAAGAYGSQGGIVAGGPNGDRLYLFAANESEPDLKIYVYDMLGNLIASAHMASVGGYLSACYDKDAEKIYFALPSRFGVFDCVNNRVDGVASTALYSSASPYLNGIVLDPIRRRILAHHSSDGISFFDS